MDRLDRNINVNVALGIVLGSVLTAATIALYETPAATFNLDTLGKLAAILIAPFTLGLVALSWVLARETRQMWKQNRLPHVIVTIEPTAVSLMFFDLVVENVGAGPAFNVRAIFDPELAVTNAQRPSVVSSHSVLHPPTLKPKQRISTFLARWDEIAPRQATVRCTCTDAEGTEHEFINVVDLASYDGRTQLGEDPIEKMSGDVEKMRKAIENIATGWSRIEVNTHNGAERAVEHAEQQERMREFQQRNP